MKKIKIYIIVLLVYFSNIALTAEKLSIEQVALISIEDKITDTCIREEKYGLAFPEELKIYGSEGKLQLKIENLKKFHNRTISFYNEITSTLAGKQDKNLKIFRNGKLLKELYQSNFTGCNFYDQFIKDRNTILLIGGIPEKKVKEKVIEECIFKYDVLNNALYQLAGLNKMNFNDYFFHPNPFTAVLANLLLCEKNYIVYDNNIEIYDYSEWLLKEYNPGFSQVPVDDFIKDYYNEQLSSIPLLKFNFPKKTPAIYKVYTRDEEEFIIDSWENKYKRIKNQNESEFILYHLDKDEIKKLSTNINPDDILALRRNCIIIRKDEKNIILGRILIGR